MKKTKKTASKKAASPLKKIFMINIAYRHEDGIETIVFVGKTQKEAFQEATKQMIVEVKEYYALQNIAQEATPYPNTLKMIKDDVSEEEFIHYYDQYSALDNVYDSSWSTVEVTVGKNGNLNTLVHY